MPQPRRTKSQLLDELTALRHRIAELEALNYPSLVAQAQAAQQMAETAHQQLSTVLESVSDSFVALDTNWCYTFVNARAAQTFGRQPADLIGKHIWTEFPEGVGQPFYHAYYRAVETQRPITLEEYYAPYDRWFENRIYPSPAGLSIFFHDITDRKRLEIALRENDERLTRILETLPSGLVIVDSDGEITQANPEAERILGLAHSDLAGRKYNAPAWRIAAVDGGAFPADQLPFVRVRQTDQPVYDVQHAIERPDGIRVIISINAAPVHDTAGHLIGMVATLTDITERRHAEELLRTSETRLLKAQVIGQFGYWEQMMTGTTIWASAEAMKIYGFPPMAGELPIETIAACIPDRGLVRQAAIDLSEHGKKYAIEFLIHPADGSPPRIISALADLERDAQGQPVKLVGTLQDITDRKHAEEAVRQSEEKFNKAFHNSPDAITITRAADGLLVEVNESLERISGYAREEVVGQTSVDLKLWVNASDRARYFATLKNQGRVSDFETVFRTKTGEIRQFVLAGEMYEAGGQTYILGIIRDITVRKRAEEQVHYQAGLIANVLDAVIATDLQFNIQFWNAAAETQYGWTFAEVMGRPLTNFIQNEYVNDTREATIHAVLEQGVWKGEVVQTRRNGVTVPVLSTVSLLKDRQGIPIGFVAVNQDITALKRSEAALRESEERFSKAFYHSPIGIALTNLADLTIRDVNTALLEMIGLTREQIVGQNVLKLGLQVEPGARAVMEQSLQEYGSYYNQEVQFRLASGDLRDMLSSGARVTIGGEPHNLASFQDITDRKRAADQLLKLNVELERRVADRTEELRTVNDELELELAERRRVEDLLRDQADLLDLTHDAILVRDMESRILFWNSGAEETYGWSRTEAVGQVTHTLLQTEFPHGQSGVQQALLTTGRWEGELKHTGRDGRIHVILSRQTLQHDVHAQPRRILEINRDITPRKQAEELLRAKNEELKAFAYTVSHDLKAPLRGISGYAQELNRRHQTGLTDRAQFCLTQIITATRNLDQLIEDLLHYSRLDAETPTLTEINVRAMIERLLLDRQTPIAEQGTQVTLDLPFESIRGWERGLTQALANLIDNALKYSRLAQPPQISIHGEERTNVYRLMIRDNGIGFDMKYHDRIFGLFNRLVRSTEFEGTGAGLAIAKKAIERQGGRLWAESQPGAGATFTIELPKSGEHS